MTRTATVFALCGALALLSFSPNAASAGNLKVQAPQIQAPKITGTGGGNKTITPLAQNKRIAIEKAGGASGGSPSGSAGAGTGTSVQMRKAGGDPGIYDKHKDW